MTAIAPVFFSFFLLSSLFSLFSFLFVPSFPFFLFLFFLAFSLPFLPTVFTFLFSGVSSFPRATERLALLASASAYVRVRGGFSAKFVVGRGEIR